MKVTYRDLQEHIEHDVEIFKEGGNYILSCNDCSTDICEFSGSPLKGHEGHMLGIVEGDDGNVSLYCVDCNEVLMEIELDETASNEIEIEYDENPWDII